MKYFSVEEEYMEGFTKRREVYKNGEPLHDSYYDVEETRRIYLGFNVFELDETGLTTNVEFYPLKTNMRTLEDNREEVLEQIRQDYSANNGWQNNNW